MKHAINIRYLPLSSIMPGNFDGSLYVNLQLCYPAYLAICFASAKQPLIKKEVEALLGEKAKIGDGGEYIVPYKLLPEPIFEIIPDTPGLV